MDIRNCKRCGKVFQYRNSSVCGNCLRQDQEDFEKVRDYIFDHADSTVLEISNATGVDLKTITRFLREGRLESEWFDSSGLGLECEKCGAPIGGGRYCDSCVNDLKRDLGGSTGKVDTQIPLKRAGAVVHTYDNILKRK